MSKQAATLLMGLLALAEGRSNDMNYLSEANREDVLDEISPEMLDRIAYRLYAEEEEHLSAYERLLKDDKRRKMDYLNNIRPDLLPQEREEREPARHHEDHYAMEEVPTDPTKESIRDKVLRESQRRQNDLMETKRQKEELSRAEKERQERDEELATLSPEEREQKKLHDKWRREFEREQHALEEEEERRRKSNDLARYQDEMTRKEKDEARKAREELRKAHEEEERHQNDLIRKNQEAQTKQEKEQARADREARKKARDIKRKEKEQKRTRKERQLKQAEQIIKDQQNDEELDKDLSQGARQHRQTERMAHRLSEGEAMADKDHQRRERERRRDEKAEQKRLREEKEKREEEAYRLMLEEEHRHEERVHRRKERALEKEKKREERRRKEWEEYEKCLEHRAERSDVSIICDEPDFHHKHHHKREFRRAVSEDQKDLDEREDYWSEDEEGFASDDYDFLEPFNGNGNGEKEPNHAENAENDLIPRTFDDLKRPKQKKPVKKPIEETQRVPNTPWLNLVDDEELNDINFDVDQKFKFRMPTTENFKGRDVKFNVKLPKDLMSGGGDKPTPTPPTPPGPDPTPPGPDPTPPGPDPADPVDDPTKPVQPAQVPDVDTPAALYQAGYDDYYDEEDYGDEYYDEEDEADDLYGYEDTYSVTPDFDPEYEQFAQDTQYWGRYESPDYYMGNESADPLALVPKMLSYRPHSKHQDDYFLDHRHHMTQGEISRALELDPHHFHKVTQEPVHHEHKYFSEYDQDFSDYSDDDDYYEGLIGYGDYSDQDIGFTSEQDSNGFDEYNDIQFSINEDVQFKLSTSDNYEGRDIDVGIVMPGDFPSKSGGGGGGGGGTQPAAKEMALYADPPSHYGQTTTAYAQQPTGRGGYMAGYQTGAGAYDDRDYGYGRGMDYETARQRQFDQTAYPAAHGGPSPTQQTGPAGPSTLKAQRREQKRLMKLQRRQAKMGGRPPPMAPAAPMGSTQPAIPPSPYGGAPQMGSTQPAIPPQPQAQPPLAPGMRRTRRAPMSQPRAPLKMDYVSPYLYDYGMEDEYDDEYDSEEEFDDDYGPEDQMFGEEETEFMYGQHATEMTHQQQQPQMQQQQPYGAQQPYAGQAQQPMPQQPMAQQQPQQQQRRKKRRQQQQPMAQAQMPMPMQQPMQAQTPMFDQDSQMAQQKQKRQRKQRQQPQPQVAPQMPMQPQQQPPQQQPMMGVPTGQQHYQQQQSQQRPQQQKQKQTRRAAQQPQLQQPLQPQQQKPMQPTTELQPMQPSPQQPIPLMQPPQQQQKQQRRKKRRQQQEPMAQAQQPQAQQPQIQAHYDVYGRPIQQPQIPQQQQQPVQQPHLQQQQHQPKQPPQPQYQPQVPQRQYYQPQAQLQQPRQDYDPYAFSQVASQQELMQGGQTAFGGEWESLDDDEADFYSDYGDELGYDIRPLSMYQDGIAEDDLSENARHYPQMSQRRGNRRRARKSQHRYPHHTHERRATEHSFADQGPTHFGQQHPYHTAEELASDLAQVGHPPAHPMAHPPAHPMAHPPAHPMAHPTQDRMHNPDDDTPLDHYARPLEGQRRRRRRPVGQRRGRRHMVFNDESEDDDSSSSSSDTSDSEDESNFGFTSDEEYERRHLRPAQKKGASSQRHPSSRPHYDHPYHQNSLENQFGMPMPMLKDEDFEDDYYDEEYPMGNLGYDDLYYDEEDDYYSEDGLMMDDLMGNSDSSSSSSSSSEENEGPTAGAPGQDVEINVEITEKKNGIIEIPVDVHDEEHQKIRTKVDNDMETSDLGFSEDIPVVEEHTYQIEATGEFEIEQSVTDNEAGGINKEMSVDFSEGSFSDFTDLSHGAVYGPSQASFSYYSSSEANDLSEDDYMSSYGRYSDARPAHFEDDDWSRFVHDEARYGKRGEPRLNQEATPAAPAPASAAAPPAPGASSVSSGPSSASSSLSSSSSSSSTISSSSSSSSGAPKANGISNHLIPHVPKQPKQPANVWHSRDYQLMSLYGVDDERTYDYRGDAESEGERDFWKRKMLDVDDYHHKNLSFDNSNMDNLVRGKGSKPIELKPRMPTDSQLVNDKSKNKRTQAKPKPAALGLQASIDQDKFKEKKSAPPPKAYQGKTKRREDPKERYTHPQTLGSPIEPLRKAEKPKEQAQPVQQETQRRHQEYEDTYRPRRAPRYGAYGEDIEAEDMSFNFKKESKPVYSGDKQRMTELHDPHTRLPDEFHNVDFERSHPQLVQPAHFTKYDPLVEGFYGSGYNFEPMEQAKHQVQEHQMPRRESHGFTPGLFAAGDYDSVQGQPQATQMPYYQDMGLRDPYSSTHVEDERASLDLYMPGYARQFDQMYQAPYGTYSHLYEPAYVKESEPKRAVEQPVSKTPMKQTQEPKRMPVYQPEAPKRQPTQQQPVQKVQPKPVVQQAPKPAQKKPVNKDSQEDYYKSMFRRESKKDSIGDAQEQYYFQEEHPRHHQEVPADSSYYSSMFASPHHDVSEHLPNYHDFETHSGYTRPYPEYEEWTHGDSSHQGYYLQSTLTPEENEYLALYGASELFGQLADMQPRQPRKKRSTPRRNGIHDSNSDDSEDSTDESATPSANHLDGYSMSLYGSGELFAQLQSENGLERATKRWRPQHKRRDDEYDTHLFQ